MQVPSIPFTVTTTPENQTPVLVREYNSARALRDDARGLYARSGYTIANTSGLAHRGYVRRILGFFGLRQEHLVITYHAPTNEWPIHAATR
jgi:hypothetical protein